MGKSKLSALLLSIVVAFSLWLYVVNNVSKEASVTFSGIKVTMEGTALEERGLMLTSDMSYKTVSLHLTGARSELNKLNAENIKAKVDLSEIQSPGEYKLPYEIKYPEGVSSKTFVMGDIRPKELVVVVDEYEPGKEIPVEVKWTGTRSKDYLYDMEGAKLDDLPAKEKLISIKGPAAVANLITKAVIEVDLSKRRESFSESFRLTLCDAEGNPVPNLVDITPSTTEVRLDMEIKRIKDVKLGVNLVYGGGANESNTKVILDTQAIRVTGSDAALSNLGDTLTIATINLADVERTGELVYPIVLPEGVTNQTGVSEVKVTVRYSGLRTKKFIVENIQSVNVPEGMAAEIDATKLEVTVRGSEEEINKLTEKDIFAVVDFTNAEAGIPTTYTATITFSEEFKTVGALKPHEIKVSANVQPKGD